MEKIAEDTVEIIALEYCEAFTIELRSDGILHSHTSSNIDFDINSLKKFNEVMGRMLNYKKAPLLITFDEFAIPPADTRVFWARKESCPWSLADAYVATNMGHRIIGGIYLRFNKPGRTTKIFNTKPEAVKWLRTFL
ncbi:MAG: hypothetical protein K0S33_461 [Bacteroidetes bacterium]|nr:hypothetical protein [Bacteroidota bacterium]